MKSRWLALLLVPIALVCVLLLCGVMFLVLSVAPPGVSVAALCLLVVVGLWLVLRPRAGSGVVSEASLMGRQSSKDGLL